MNDEYPSPPDDLGDSGDRLWRAITENEWILRADELAILHAACRCEDAITRLQNELVGQPETVKGSMGQQVINPLRAEIRFQDAAKANHLAKLKFPDLDKTDPGSVSVFRDVPMTRSAVGRKGADARWRNRYAAS